MPSWETFTGDSAVDALWKHGGTRRRRSLLASQIESCREIGTSGVRRHLRGCRNGLLVEPATRLAQWSSSSLIWKGQSRREAGRARAVTRFGWEQYVDSWLSAYTELAHGGR